MKGLGLEKSLGPTRQKSPDLRPDWSIMSPNLHSASCKLRFSTVTSPAMSSHDTPISRHIRPGPCRNELLHAPEVLQLAAAAHRPHYVKRLETGAASGGDPLRRETVGPIRSKPAFCSKISLRQVTNTTRAPSHSVYCVLTATVSMSSLKTILNRNLKESWLFRQMLRTDVHFSTPELCQSSRQDQKVEVEVTISKRPLVALLSNNVKSRPFM